MTECMIDLETMGTQVDAPVISIGAIFFDIATKQLGPKFYTSLKLDEQFKVNRTLSYDTLKFWMRQDDKARQVLLQDSEPTIAGLHSFIRWFNETNKQANVWGNGSSFDISIMEHLFTSFDLKAPWSYRNIMDLRTFKRFKAPDKKIITIGTTHNALDDAISQAQFVLENI